MAEESVFERLVKEVLEEHSHEYFLVGFSKKGSANQYKLTFFVDGDKGMSIDNCASISRKLSRLIEERDLIDGPYIIEVSTPGADQPLKLRRQYNKHIGRKMEVILTNKESYIGTLLKVEESGIMLEEIKKKDKKEHHILFENIKKAKVKISFK